jgi:hypothetical protein
MNINKNVKLILRDVYLYDIEACHYTIMTKLGMDLSGVDRDNKLERNIHIGKMMRKNPKLTSILRTTTRSIIDEYILRNNITDDDIILRQYDGIIITKTLAETDIHHVPLNIRKHFQIFISSIDRQKYIAFDSEFKTSIKGVPFRYNAIDKIYDQICRINYANKDSIFRNLQRIKDKFINSNNPKLFGVPLKNGKVNVFLKGYGEMEISPQTLKIMDTDDIDKDRYFKFYIQPFTKSIVVEFVRR